MTKSAAGRLGYMAQVEKHGIEQVRRWRSLGGRRPDPTWDEIQAGTGPRGRSKGKGGAAPKSTTGGAK